MQAKSIKFNLKQDRRIRLLLNSTHKKISSQIGNHNLLTTFCLISLALSIALILFTLPNLAHHAASNSLSFGFIIFGSLATLLLLKMEKLLSLAASIFLSSHLAGLTMFSLSERVPISGTYIWFAILGVFGIYLFEWKFCKYWLLAVCSCQVILLHLFRHTDSLIPLGISQTGFIDVFRADVVSSTLGLWIVVVIYEKRRQKANKKLAETQAELALHKEQAMKVARLNELIQMAGGVAHEINNPLAIIDGFTRVLKKDLQQQNKPNTNMDLIFAKIESSCLRISEVAQSLLTYAEGGQIEEVDRFSLLKLKTEASSFCQEKLAHRDIAFRVHCQSPNTEISAAYLKILQILINLLNNSIDAVTGGVNKWIELKLAIHEGKLTLTVSDSGLGIASEFKNRIHAPFFTTKALGKGPGLGLSIVDGLVRELRGLTYLDSEASYTSFVVILPIDQTSSANIY